MDNSTNLPNGIEKYNEDAHGPIELWAWYIFRAAIVLLSIVAILVIVWLGIAAIERFDFSNIGLLVGTGFIGLVIIGLIIPFIIILRKGFKYKKFINNMDKLLVAEAKVIKFSMSRRLSESSAQRQFSPIASPSSEFSFDHAQQPLISKHHFRVDYEYVNEIGRRVIIRGAPSKEKFNVGDKVKIFFYNGSSFAFFSLKCEPVNPKGTLKEQRKVIINELKKTLRNYFDRYAISQKNLDELELLAEGGNAEAQYEMGAAYFFADKVAFDNEKIVYWWAEASKQKHDKAWIVFGIYQKHVFYNSAKKMFKKIKKHMKV